MRFIYNKNQAYSTRFFLYNYNDNDFRIVKVKSCRNSGFEELKKNEKIFNVNSEESKRASLSRSKRFIRELALCNSFTYFATITINSVNCDRYSLDNAQASLRKILKKIKRVNNDFAYLFITEKHKDGAFHFHGLVRDLPDIYTNNYGYLSSHYFDDLGFNSFSKIKDYSKCCNYITKYITKDCIKNTNGHIYISSKGLNKACREEFSQIDFIPSFSNDYVEMKDFKLSDITLDEKLYFLSLKEGKTNFLSNIINS